MATILARTSLTQICLLLITAINIAVSSSDNSVLTELYKQAAKENRPLILVVDNHDKKQQNVHQVSKQRERGSPFYYIQTPKKSSGLLNTPSRTDNKPMSKQQLLKLHLKHLRLEEHANNNKGKIDHSYQSVRSRHHRGSKDPDDRYRSNRDRSKNGDDDRRDRYDDKHRDHHRYDDEGDRGHDRNDNRDREYRSRDNKHNRDRYRDDRHRDRNRHRDNRHDDRDRHRNSEKDRKNRHKDITRHRPSQKTKSNYGTSVLTNLLRISNDLNCDALSECKFTCRYARSGKKNDCEKNCEEKYECEVEKVAGRNIDRASSGDCGNNGHNSCAESDEGDTDMGMSTRGPTDDDIKQDFHNGGSGRPGSGPKDIDKDLEKCSASAGNSEACV